MTPDSKRISVCLLAAMTSRHVLDLLGSTNRTTAVRVWEQILESMEQLRQAIAVAWPKEGDK